MVLIANALNKTLTMVFAKKATYMKNNKNNKFRVD